MKSFRLFPVLLITAFMTGCSVVPLTGRKQMLLVSDNDVLTSSLTQYNDYIQKWHTTLKGDEFLAEAKKQFQELGLYA